jgi:hypothetical protein
VRSLQQAIRTRINGPKQEVEYENIIKIKEEEKEEDKKKKRFQDIFYFSKSHRLKALSWLGITPLRVPSWGFYHSRTGLWSLVLAPCNHFGASIPYHQQYFPY